MMQESESYSLSDELIPASIFYKGWSIQPSRLGYTVISGEGERHLSKDVFKTLSSAFRFIDRRTR